MNKTVLKYSGLQKTSALQYWNNLRFNKDRSVVFPHSIQCHRSKTHNSSKVKKWFVSVVFTMY